MNLMDFLLGEMNYLWTVPFGNRRTRKMFFLVLSILAPQMFQVQSSQVDYCKKDLQCIEGSKTIKNSACGCPEVNKTACGMTPIVRRLSNDEADYVVDRHNFHRHKVASGKENRSGNVGATDMMAMVYNTDLEYSAFCYSFKCNEEPDQCHLTEEFKTNGAGRGQNQYHWLDDRPCDKTTIDAAMQSWYQEIVKMGETVACIISLKCSLHEVSQYTQLVWSSTTDVGCAFVHYNKSYASYYSVACNLFCNYGPPGNLEGARVYTLGPPNRDCKKTHKRYPSLCVGEKPQSGDHDLSPVSTIDTAVSTTISLVPSTILLMLLLVLIIMINM